EKVHRARVQRDSEIRLAEIALQVAEDEEGRLRKLRERQATTVADWIKAAAKAREEKEKLAKARLPVEESGVDVARRASDLAWRDYTVSREQTELKRASKRNEIEAAEQELANLLRERGQAVIRAPIDGVVTTGDVKCGDILEPGKPVSEIAEQRGFEFEAA